jgi:hypothetical protein
MLWNLCLLLSTVVGAAPVETASDFVEYGPAYYAAQESRRPLLVILNSGPSTAESSVKPEDIRKARVRRELLKQYTVVVVDVSTEAGRRTHHLFGAPALPYVSVIDKQQKYQLYQSSKPHAAADWNLLLEKHKDGTLEVAKSPSNCCTGTRASRLPVRQQEM